MHKIWLDTNVLLGYLLRRTGFETPAMALLSEADFLLTRNLTDFAAGAGPVVCSVEHYLVFFQK